MARPNIESSCGCTAPFFLFIVVVLLAMGYACHYYQKQVTTEAFSNPKASLQRPPVASATFDGPAPLTYTMGDYDGIALKTMCKDGWKKTPCSAPLGEPSRNDTVHGHSIPLKHDYENTVNNFPNAPSIDGTKDQPQSDFMFAYNKSSPLCCPSTYSTSTGCVCSTPEQRDWLQSRGNNSPNQYEDL